MIQSEKKKTLIYLPSKNFNSLYIEFTYLEGNYYESITIKNLFKLHLLNNKITDNNTKIISSLYISRVMVNLFYNFFNYINNENYCGLLNINNKFIILVSSHAEIYILKKENTIFFPFSNKCQYYLLEIKDYSLLTKNIEKNFLLKIKKKDKITKENLLKKKRENENIDIIKLDDSTEKKIIDFSCICCCLSIREIIFFKCMHLCYCNECYKKLLKKFNGIVKCPICMKGTKTYVVKYP